MSDLGSKSFSGEYIQDINDWIFYNLLQFNKKKIDVVLEAKEKRLEVTAIQPMIKVKPGQTLTNQGLGFDSDI